jgi:general secretion pathway protein E
VSVATASEFGRGDADVGSDGGARFVDLIPREFARRHLVVQETSDAPIPSDAPSFGPHTAGATAVGGLLAAHSTPDLVLWNVAARLGRTLPVRRTDGEEVARRVDELYERARREVPNERERAVDAAPATASLDRLLAEADRDLLNVQGKGKVVLLVDALLFEALGRDASDVHIQPLPDRTIVRYRLDGVLHDVRELPPELAVAVTSRIKVMGRMDIAERRVPQDGRATVKIGERPIDLRISTVPTSHGERAVLRLLDHSRQLTDFAGLGMPERIAGPFLERASRPNGIILVTGPTGSGKTTTLYATLLKIGTSRVNIMTIEDPIEYELSSAGLRVSQSQVNARKGVTFATGLRHILRQDPDVVMVGEIRDTETARTAIQASLTGHLVLSTLHTNDAPSAITRLVDLGVEPYLVSASLSAVLAQRLVRRFHRDCDGAGCEGCLGTGFRGRTGVFEFLSVSERVRAMVKDGSDASGLRTVGREEGMATLAEEGVRLVAERVTTEDEVARVLVGIS